MTTNSCNAGICNSKYCLDRVAFDDKIFDILGFNNPIWCLFNRTRWQMKSTEIAWFFLMNTSFINCRCKCLVTMAIVIEEIIEIKCAALRKIRTCFLFDQLHLNITTFVNNPLTLKNNCHIYEVFNPIHAYRCKSTNIFPLPLFNKHSMNFNCLLQLKCRYIFKCQ